MRTSPNMIARSLRVVAQARVTGLKAEDIHIRKSTSVHVITNTYARPTAVIKLDYYI